VVGDAHDLVEPVRDEDHGGAGIADVANQPEQLVNLVRGERRRGLVEHHDAATLLPAGDGAHDRHGGPLRWGRLGERSPRVHVEGEAREELCRDLRLAPPVDAPEAVALEADDETDVVDRPELGNDAELLVDEPQALALGLFGMAELQHLVVDPGLRARVGRVHAGQRLDQGRLAAPVVPQQRVHGADGDVEVDLADCLDAWECLGQPAHAQRRAGLIVTSQHWVPLLFPSEAGPPRTGDGRSTAATRRASSSEP
jgi:hypothetical protein